jgi:uncharacterized protein YdhG (YjbR/CyaY superfamily)
MAPPKATARPKAVTEYIAAASKESRPHLRAMRKTVRAAAPGAIENLKWGMPAYSYRRILVMFAGFKNHVSLFPTMSAVRAFKKELGPRLTSAGTVQFPLDKPIPLALVRKITLFRVKESLEKDGKWRAKI